MGFCPIPVNATEIGSHSWLLNDVVFPILLNWKCVGLDSKCDSQLMKLDVQFV